MKTKEELIKKAKDDIETKAKGLGRELADDESFQVKIIATFEAMLEVLIDIRDILNNG